MARRSWLLPAALGATAGFAAGWLLARSRPEARHVVGPAEPDTSWADRWGERVDAAVDAAADGFRAVERRWRASRPLALAPLVDALDRVPGAEELRLTVLGDGLIEIEGTASDEALEVVRASLLDQDGVRVVLSRAWTPSSADPGTN